MAAGEWVYDYVQSRKRGERKEVAELRTAELAQLRAPGFFESLLGKVARDVHAFDSYRGNGWVSFQLLDRFPDGEYVKRTGFFVAQREQYPFVTLIVRLRDIFIEYESTVIKEIEHKETTRGTFRIVADLQGRAHATLDGEPYCDVSEISEFLLRPVFDCVDFRPLSW